MPTNLHVRAAVLVAVVNTVVDRLVTTPPREQGGFLGDACLSPATLPPTGPVRAGRFRERGSERLTARRHESPPGSVRLCRLRRSGAATLRALYYGLV